MDSGAGCSRSRHSHTGERTDSSNLRDLLRIKEEDNNRTGLTLRAILTNDPNPAQTPPNRTLLDIILDDDTIGGSSTDSDNTWKLLRDRLRLRRTGSQIPASEEPMMQRQNSNGLMTRQRSLRGGSADVPYTEDSFPQSPSRDNNAQVSNNRSMSLRRNSIRVPERQCSRMVTRQNSGVGGDSDEDLEEGEGNGEGGEDPPVRMSLMSLLAENDGSAYGMEEEEEDEEESGGGIEYNNCCVCMVRHKGSAFIPCGHTFCRLCSRELWVQRGNCPLCNNYILEILDIF